ncbi:MAG: hypothetical protein JO197_11565 [Acidobacteria bacterium]|nr:hypothetical protein [Acidobacteriota bacterium]MBV9476114.1 hypothetical protein [Acidobacteriota bacterium]
MKRVAFLLIFLAACGGHEPAATNTSTTTAPAKPATPPPPTVAEAKTLLENAPELGEFQFTDAAYSLPMQTSVMNDPTRAALKDLQRAGWLAVDGSGGVMLTPKARDDKRFLLRANGILDIVPLAKKELRGVTDVRANPDGTATADFAWAWIANDVGNAFTTGEVHDRFMRSRQSRATLIWDGKTWSVLRIE